MNEFQDLQNVCTDCRNNMRSFRRALFAQGCEEWYETLQGQGTATLQDAFMEQKCLGMVSAKCVAFALVLAHSFVLG